MTYSSTRQNLLIDVQGSNEGVKSGGAPIERIITVRNRGSEHANIDLWIRSNDARSEPLIRWCTLGTNTTIGEVKRSREVIQGEQGFSGLRLPQVEPQSSREVILRFDVPAQAEPGFYSYDIVAQAPQYPGEQSRRTQQLRVLASGQDVGLRSEPNWSVEPVTSSEMPYSLKAGAIVPVKFTVTNRSDAVDRFYLSCPELHPDWFDAPLYPETNPDAPGLLTRTDGLMLNPGESGEITLVIHPPTYTPAGYYSSTIRLTSFNRENLVLLDIVYLKVEVNDRLLLDLQPPSQKIPSAIEAFLLTLTNAGNVVRAVGIQAGDRDEIFVYSLELNSLLLVPGQSQTVTLTPKPKKWWRRSWRGQEQEIDFGVELFETQAAEAENGTLYLPEPALGTIFWQSRPTWILQFLKFLRLLLLALVILLLLSGAVWLAYWLLRELIVKPSLEPQILEFSSTEESYQAGTGNPIRLDWKISNPEAEAQAIVTYYASDGSDLLNRAYPLPTLGNTPETSTCEAGTYQPNVALRLLRRLYGHTPTIDTVTCIGIAPQPEPPDVTFNPGEYQVNLEVLPMQTADSQQSPDSQRGWLSRFTANSQRPRSWDAQRLRNLKLTPAPPLPLPEVLYFFSKTPVYRQADAATADAADAANGALPQFPATPIQLNWVINDSREIAAIELNEVHIAPNGGITSRQVRYPVQNGVPVPLADRCRLEAVRLVCENVPTEATTAGKYTFTLNLVMSEARGAARITKDSEPIEIRPPLPAIRVFTANDVDVLKNPQLVQLVDPMRGRADITLNWEVADPDQVKVELLPAPGMVAATGNMRYALSPTPGSTTLTLQVSNQAGETVSRSVVIQTAMFPPPPPPLPVPAAGAAAPAGAAPSAAPDAAAPGAPVAPGELPPFELPPRAN
jgi:hypothetical protein